MVDLINLLNTNAGAIQVLFSGLVTLATVVYAILTWVLVTETRRMRRAQTNAKMTISLESRKEWLNFIDVVVRNEGLGPAFGVRFTVEPVGTGGDLSIAESIRSFGFIERGLDYFSPGQELRSFLTSMVEGFDAKLATRVAVTIRYRTAFGEELSDSYLLDFSFLKGMTQLGEPDLHGIAKAVKSIAEDMGHLTNGFNRLEVITQDRTAYLREQQEREVRDRKGLQRPSEQEGGGATKG